MSKVITSPIGWSLGITELIAGFAGWKGSEIRFQPGSRVMLTGLARVTFQLAAWPSVPDALPAESSPFTVRVYSPTFGFRSGIVYLMLSWLC